MTGQNIIKPNSGWVAGVNHGSHDSSAVLLHEGKTIVFIEQERLSRRKHAEGESPSQALSECLRYAGITIRDLDCIALGSDHEALAHWLGLSEEGKKADLPYDSFEHLFAGNQFTRADIPPIVRVRHHLSHAASAFFPSGFNDAAALVMDAMGEDVSSTIFKCAGNKLELKSFYNVEDSLGFFYEAASEYAGFNKMEAGKFMGLASYGRPNMKMPIQPDVNATGQIWTRRAHANATGRNGINLRHADLLNHFQRHHFPYSAGSADEPMAYADFAASAQHALESCVLALARRAIEETGSRNLVLAGGVALNCSANGLLARSNIAQSMYVQPAASDVGVALGAALLASAELYGAKFSPTRMTHPYWSLEDRDEHVARALVDAKLAFTRLSNEQVGQSVGDIISNGGIVAWHQGRAEVGPRALGARSLLGNPGKRQTLIKMNKIKERELWRPLAPSVLEESFEEYFDGIPNPFMIVAASVKEHVRNRIPAIVHVDGSARPHVVTKNSNPTYWLLLKRVKEKTGLPIVINTSLNGKGEPICFRAEDSIRFFLTHDIDALAINNFLVEK
ncbi:carbamoyltransferase family protein [Ensifer aridi]|uniref:carbamoyltransferase family protein n=1 Tax=Ensifer aridi TaxID=1708715 RepID=UPI0011116907|nr:carbamoyltransferase C-terminal domain-containing protein [Ensifer aridi]